MYCREIVCYTIKCKGKSGSNTIIITIPLPQHQHSVIPAGAKHGFEAKDGFVLVLFVEVVSHFNNVDKAITYQ